MMAAEVLGSGTVREHSPAGWTQRPEMDLDPRGVRRKRLRRTAETTNLQM